MANAKLDDGRVQPTDWMPLADRLLDLTTDRHIEDDPLCTVVENLLEPYQQLLPYSVLWGHLSYNAEEFRTWLTLGEWTREYIGVGMVVIQRPDADSLTFYLRGQGAWKGVRAEFESIKIQLADIMSYSPDSLAAPCEEMSRIVQRLQPVADASAQLKALTEPGPVNAEDVADALRAMSDYNQHWGAAGDVGNALAPWTGAAAEIFKGAYIDLMPSILLGQAIVATALMQALDLAAKSYRGLRDQSLVALQRAVDTMELYPLPYDFEEPDWEEILDIIAGVAGIVAGISGFFPGAGILISVLATLIGGTASLYKTIALSPELDNAKAKPVDLGGDSASEIFYNFQAMLTAYQNTVDNTETVLGRCLSELQGVAEDTTAAGITIRLTWSQGEYKISQRNSYFVTLPPTLKDITGDIPFSEVSGNAYMGAAPRAGEPFAVDLQKLLQSGHNWIPELSANYAAVISWDAGAGVDNAFLRPLHGMTTTDGDGQNATRGKLYHPWISLYGALMTMLRESGVNLASAAVGLIAAAELFAAEDAEAANYLRDNSGYY